MLILHIATGKHPFNIGFCGTRNGFNVARFIGFDKIFENIGVWLVPNGHEKTCYINFNIFPFSVGKNGTINTAHIANNFFCNMLVKYFDFRCIRHPVLHCFRGS